MSNQYLLALFIFALIVFGCRSITWHELRPITRNPDFQTTVYIDGNEVYASLGSVTLVNVCGKRLGDGCITLYVQYINKSDCHLNVNPRLIRVFAIDENGKKRNLKVYLPKEYLKKAGARFVRGEKFSLAMESLKDAFDEATDQGPKKIGIIGYVGNQPVYGEVKDEEATKRARELRKLKQNLIKHQEKEYLTEVENRLLKKNTIAPEQGIVGEVKVELFKDAKRFIVEVPAGPDKHIIEFEPIGES